MKVSKENISNRDALWQWVKRECDLDNVESVELETEYDDGQLDNSPLALAHVKSRTLVIKFGPDDYIPVFT